MGVSADAPSLDSAYKLVAYVRRPVMKLSPGKITAPGAKQVYRGPGSDVLALREEPSRPGHWHRPGDRVSRRMTTARTWLCGTLSTASQDRDGAVRLALLRRAACWR
jgi:nicotinic acid phosphoribosyltransferase